jgi:hypothetical protein
MADEKKTAPAPKEAIDPDNVTLGADKLAAIREKARAMVAKERLDALEKMALDKALEDIRGKAGNITGDPEEDRLVNLTIDTGAGAVGQSSNGQELNGIRLNGREFTNGKTYEVPIHQARTLMEIMYRTHLHEHSLTDKPLSEFYRKPRHTLLTRRGAVNAPRRPDEMPAGAA